MGHGWETKPRKDLPISQSIRWEFSKANETHIWPPNVETPPPNCLLGMKAKMCFAKPSTFLAVHGKGILAYYISDSFALNSSRYCFVWAIWCPESLLSRFYKPFKDFALRNRRLHFAKNKQTWTSKVLSSPRILMPEGKFAKSPLLHSWHLLPFLQLAPLPPNLGLSALLAELFYPSSNHLHFLAT